jgi:MSHA pilin protein MshD
MSTRRTSLGLSLIEVVIFIVVLSVGLVAMLAIYNRHTEASVDPMVRKQALAIASSLMDEIQLKGFTYCDPDDPKVYTAASEAGCDTAEVLPTTAPLVPNEQAESRAGATRFDNVNDYNGFSMVAIQTADGTPVNGLNGYQANVSIAQIDANELGASIPATEALRITVTVIGPTGLSVSLQGYRIRYAPNTP